MDRYEISLMTFMALWWLFNVVSVWLKAKQWHIKVLLGGTLLYVIQISAVIMSVNGLNWIFLNVSTIKNTNELIIALLVLNFLGCWLLALWLGMLALKLCLRNKNEEKYIAPPLGTALIATSSCTLLFLFCLLILLFN
ncbi:hypothetical protein ACTHRY_06075 [Neisseria sp. P0004.S004]|jgi:hypothetical protein|uniref:hypothetical protein n=1 Tax=Neisseria TaxID=482 RepID=UPI00066A81FF|nr:MULTISPECIES: hypothetical protein [Neisseria]MCL9792417.1 hypothetical protein [Neisseria subflava]OHP51323.1 hypothetical protein HMPREF2661_03815 [Neisseria sp. HMSC061B04]